MCGSEVQCDLYVVDNLWSVRDWLQSTKPSKDYNQKTWQGGIFRHTVVRKERSAFLLIHCSQYNHDNQILDEWALYRRPPLHPSRIDLIAEDESFRVSPLSSTNSRFTDASPQIMMSQSCSWWSGNRITRSGIMSGIRTRLWVARECSGTIWLSRNSSDGLSRSEVTVIQWNGLLMGGLMDEVPLKINHQWWQRFWFGEVSLLKRANLVVSQLHYNCTVNRFILHRWDQR